MFDRHTDHQSANVERPLNKFYGLNEAKCLDILLQIRRYFCLMDLPALRVTLWLIF